MVIVERKTCERCCGTGHLKTPLTATDEGYVHCRSCKGTGTIDTELQPVKEG